VTLPDASDAADASRPVAPANEPAGITAAVVAVTAWGLGNVLIAAIPMNGLAIAFHRLWTGTVLYVAILLARGGRLRRDSIRHGWKGGVAFGANIACFFVAVRLTTVASAVTISALQPIAILGFAAVVFGERIRVRHVAATVVAVGGVALVTFGAVDVGGGDRLGDLVAVLALIAWAGYFIASKQARRHLDTLEYMAVLNLVAFLVVAPVAVATGALSGPGGALTPGRYLAIVCIVLVPGSGHVLMNWAHNHVTLVLASLITLGMPVISTAAAAVFLGQSVSGTQVVGIVVVLVALAVVITGDAREGGEAVEATEPAP
jgi:drug/metabolite transporter (DMT)-like permease